MRYTSTVYITFQCVHLFIYIDVWIDICVRTHIYVCVVLPTNAYISFPCPRSPSRSRSRSRPPSSSFAFSRSRSVGYRSLTLLLSRSLAHALSFSCSLALALTFHVHTHTHAARTLYVSFVVYLFTLFL